MTAELHELRRARPRRSIPIPASACAIFGLFGFPKPHGQTLFRLRRRRTGVSIMLVRGAFSWSVSHYEKVNPPSFAAARQWVAAYAARFGDVVAEAPPTRPPMKRPTGIDAKLLKAGGCREAWLASDVPALFAEAMVRCHHAGAYCATDGFCHFGDCNMEMVPRPPIEEELEA